MCMGMSSGRFWLDDRSDNSKGQGKQHVEAFNDHNRDRHRPCSTIGRGQGQSEIHSMKHQPFTAPTALNPSPPTSRPQPQRNDPTPLRHLRRIVGTRILRRLESSQPDADPSTAPHRRRRNPLHRPNQNRLDRPPSRTCSGQTVRIWHDTARNGVGVSVEIGEQNCSGFSLRSRRLTRWIGSAAEWH